MSRVCELTGTRPMTGNLVSHSNIKTRTRWLPNLKNKKYLIEEVGQTLSLRLSTKAIRNIDKQGGITAAIMKAKEEDLSDRLKRVRNQIAKKRRSTTPKSAAKAAK